VSRFINCYVKCRYAECLNAECLNAECLYAERIYAERLYVECLNAECLSVFMLSVFMLSLFMLSVFMLSVFMLSVVVPHFYLNSIFSFGIAKLWNKLACSSVNELRFNHLICMDRLGNSRLEMNHNVCL
jgi:hypothetical protein